MLAVSLCRVAISITCLLVYLLACIVAYIGPLFHVPLCGVACIDYNMFTWLNGLVEHFFCD